MTKNNLLFFIILVIFSASVSAADQYWIGDGQDFAIHSPTVFFLDTSSQNIGIGTSSPSYRLHVTGSGTIASITTSSGNGLEGRGITRGIEGVTTGTSSVAGVYAWATASSGTNYGVYGQATTGYSGYFTGGNGLYADNYEVFQRGNCHYNYAWNGYVDCASGYDQVMGGGCNCADCGASQVIGSYPYSNTRWMCNCRNCDAGQWRSWVICCGY